jgi:hypothetical protein
VVVLKAVVNRSFRSSLEVGLVVESEDPYTGHRQHICKAFFVFVAKPSDGGKVQLPALSPVTEEEKREFLLAAERRRMRTTYAKDIERIAKNFNEDKKRTHSLPNINPSASVTAAATIVHTDCSSCACQPPWDNIRRSDYGVDDRCCYSIWPSPKSLSCEAGRHRISTFSWAISCGGESIPSIIC